MANTMRTTRNLDLIASAIIAVVLFTSAVACAADPLPSWNDGPAKQSIVTFVDKVTKRGSPDFVPVPERIATFDNDGTLWCEKPLPVQLYFAIDRVKALARRHPEWKTREPFASILKGDYKNAIAGGDHAILELVMATHTGMTTAEFEQIVKDWIATAKHPKTGKLYTEMAYQPMLELLAYLRANGFKTFIVSGGGIEFMRPWAEKVYGIPPEQVVGSSMKTKFEMRDGKPVLVRLPELNFNDDKAGKPVGINQHIGRRPIAAFGNSRRRPGNAGIHAARQRCAVRASVCITMTRSANTPTVRQGLPDVKLGAFTQALDEAAERGLDRGQHEERLEDRFSREHSRSRPLTSCWSRTPRCSNMPPPTTPACSRSSRKASPSMRRTRPHITMLQCFVRTADLDKVYAAEEKVLAAANVKAMKLEAFKYYYAPGGATGRRRHLREADAGNPQAASGHHCRREAVHAGNRPHRRVHRRHDDPAIDAAIIQYVSTFVPKMTRRELQSARQHRRRPPEYLDQMLAEPFEPFTFSPAGAAVYQLGPFGTAAKKLKEWDLGPDGNLRPDRNVR